MVNLFLADEWVNREEDDFYLDKTKYTIPQQWKSVQVMRALRNIETVKGSFDIIEFPDFDGIAFSTLQEKNLRRAFAHSLIAVQCTAPRRRCITRPSTADLRKCS